MNTKILLNIIPIFLFLTNNSYTQVTKDSTKCSSIKSLAITIGKDFLHIATTPARISSTDGLKILTLATVTISFITILDEPIDERFVTAGENSNRGDGYLFLGKGLIKIGSTYDEISSKYFFAGLSSSMLIGGFLFNDKKLLETARLMIESFSITQSITYGSKGLFGRSRPYTGNGAHDFNLFKFSRQGEFRSCPSGHASGIFSMMTVIAKQYDYWWIKIPAYTLCVSVALQRIDDRRHWASDVIIGGALGYWVGSSLVNHNKKRTPSVTVEPFIQRYRFGLRVCF